MARDYVKRFGITSPTQGNAMKIFNRRNLLIICAVILVAGSAIYSSNPKLRLTAMYFGVPQPKYGLVTDKKIMIPMRDGVRLAADVYRPEESGRYPVIVIRTPYGRANKKQFIPEIAGVFASQGFVVVSQDCRGKLDSEGEFYPYTNEAIDGHDTFEWAGKQEWSNGNVGTFGLSYWGSTQWLGSIYGSNHLKTMIPIVTSQSLYKRWMYKGIFRLNDVFVWHYQNSDRNLISGKEIDWSQYVSHLPLIEADSNMEKDLPFYNDWIQHATPDDYWEKINVENRMNDIKASALIVGGWYDYYLEHAIDDFNRMRKQSGSPEARQSRLLIGPWLHTTKSKFEDRDFGKNAGFPQQMKYFIDWYRYWLTDEEPEFDDDKPIKIFVMGKNEWRNESEWPLAQTQWTPFYLHSQGKANTRNGNGSLHLRSPLAEPNDRFDYDPLNPAPSIGGTSIYGKATPGPVDQTAVEQRTDVLVYTSDPLPKDTEVTGPIKLELFASSSAVDTDFVATLADVDSSGKSINLRTGAIRARYRNSYDQPEFLEKDKVYKFDITIGATSNLFKKGHRIRLQLTSSYFPEMGRNLNTGAPIGLTKEVITAHQTILHNSQYPSRLILPVIP